MKLSTAMWIAGGASAVFLAITLLPYIVALGEPSPESYCT